MENLQKMHYKIKLAQQLKTIIIGIIVYSFGIK